MAWIGSLLSGLISSVLRALAFFGAGAGYAKRKAAEDALEGAIDANEKREDVRGLSDDDLRRRMRGSLK